MHSYFLSHLTSLHLFSSVTALLHSGEAGPYQTYQEVEVYLTLFPPVVGDRDFSLLLFTGRIPYICFCSFNLCPSAHLFEPPEVNSIYCWNSSF